MMRVIEEASQWRLKMKNGSYVGIWAGGYGRVDGNYVFSILVEIAQEGQVGDVVVFTRAPADPSRISIAVASIPIDDVESIETADWEKVPPSA